MRGVGGVRGRDAIEATSSRLGLVDLIKMLRENGVEEARASDEDVELVRFSMCILSLSLSLYRWIVVWGSGV